MSDNSRGSANREVDAEFRQSGLNIIVLPGVFLTEPHEKVKALAEAHLDPNRMTVVVVGEAKEIGKALEKIGPVTVYDTDLKVKTP